MSTSTSPAPQLAARPLEARVAVVTGASSGIGAATARALASGGAKVALLARRRERLDELAAELGPDALAVPVDLAREGALDRAAEAIADALGRPDLVVANAGIMLAGDITTQAPDDWRRQLDVNVAGVLETVRAFGPALLAAARTGTADLVTTSSIAARQRFPGYAVYGATKAAVTALAEGLRVELAPRGVRVTNIEPGLIATELQGKVEDPEQRAALQEWMGQMPPIDAAHVGELIAFLASRPRDVNVPQLTIMPTHQV